MLVLSRQPPLGGFTEDVISVLGPIVGESRVRSFVTSLENKIRSEAEAGARKAIPDIELAVEARAKKAVTPLVLGAMAAGIIGGLLGTWALLRTRRRA